MTIEWNYSYNDKNQLANIYFKSIRDGEIKEGRTELDYDKEGRLHQINNSTGWKWNLFYNDNNQLVQMDRTINELEPSIHLYHYNKLGQLEEIEVYSGELTDEKYAGDTKISYGNANSITIIRTLASGEKYDESIILTDDKNRPLPALPNQITMSFHTVDFVAEGIVTKHNLLSSKVRKIKPTTTVDGSFTNTFTYNEAGYPLSCIKTFDAESVEKITYTYSIK